MRPTVTPRGSTLRKKLDNQVARARGALTKERLLAIDLSKFEQLVTYPAGVDWPLCREKLLFLQTAVRLGFPFDDVVRLTYPYFGEVLKQPFEPVVPLFEMAPPSLPPFDVARQTPEQWGALADQAWKDYRKTAVRNLSEWRQEQIDRGAIREFRRSRHSNRPALKKAHIIDEATAFNIAINQFWRAKIGKPVSWNDIARKYPPSDGYSKQPHRAASQVEKRAEQIRQRVRPILDRLFPPKKTPE